MCSNYRPVTALDRLLTFFGVERAADDLPADFEDEVYPQGLAPFIRRAEDGSGYKRIAEPGQFGLVPYFGKELAFGRRTYNARSETVATLASFKNAWQRGQRCIVPAEAIYEMCHQSGRAVRWQIQQPGAVPMGIAGVYTRHPTLLDRKGRPLLSFAMLTTNADGHAVFQRMHKPSDEKRMVVIVDPAEYDRWLQCSAAEATSFFRQWMGPLDAFAAPRDAPARPPPVQRDLF